MTEAELKEAEANAAEVAEFYGTSKCQGESGPEVCARHVGRLVAELRRVRRDIGNVLRGNPAGEPPDALAWAGIVEFLSAHTNGGVA